MDGRVLENGNAKSDQVDIRTGDNGPDRFRENLVGIDISSIGGTVSSATFCVDIYKTSGDPSLVEPFYLDAVDFGPDIDDFDYGLPTIMNIATFNSAGIGLYCFDITAAVNDAWLNPKAWNKNGSSNWLQMRFRHDSVAVNGNSDTLNWYTIDGGVDPCIDYVLSPPVLQDLHHFTISHQTNVPINTWSKITIEAKNSNNFTITSNIGSVTVRVDSALGNIIWMDPGNCGSLDNYVTYIVYEFQNCENGVLSLYIMDDTDDTVNVEVRGTNITSISDDNTEGDLYFYTLADIRIHKTNVSPPGDIYPGDYIRYRVDYTNYGGPAINVVITDPIPNSSTYSLESIYDGISLSDSSGNDAGYYDGTQIIYSPNGLAPSGGTLAAGETGSFYFTVQVFINVPGGSSPTNRMVLDENTVPGREFDARIRSGNVDDLSTPNYIGDDGNDRELHAIMSFPMSPALLDPNVVITSSTLRLNFDAFQSKKASDNDENIINPVHFDLVELSNNSSVDDYDPAVKYMVDFLSATLDIAAGFQFFPMSNAMYNTIANARTNFQISLRPSGAKVDNNATRFRPHSFENAEPGRPEVYVWFYTNRPAQGVPSAVTNTVSITGNFPTTNDTIILLVVPPGAPVLSISKAISDVSINGTSVSVPVPGATVTYTVYYSNQGPMNADNMIVYDQFPADTEYVSITGGGGWTPQYSYSVSPDQSYGSPDYADTPPGVPANVLWVRWINASVAAGEAGSFTYEVIIK